MQRVCFDFKEHQAYNQHVLEHAELEDDLPDFKKNFDDAVTPAAIDERHAKYEKFQTHVLMTPEEYTSLWGKQCTRVMQTNGYSPKGILTVKDMPAFFGKSVEIGGSTQDSVDDYMQRRDDVMKAGEILTNSTTEKCMKFEDKYGSFRQYFEDRGLNLFFEIKFKQLFELYNRAKQAILLEQEKSAREQQKAMQTAEHALLRAQAAEVEKDRAIQEANDAKVKAAAAEEAAKKAADDAKEMIADKEAELHRKINETQSERDAQAQLAADLRKKLEELQAAEALKPAGGGEGGRAASPAAGGRAASPAAGDGAGGGDVSPAAGGRARVRIGLAQNVQIPANDRSPSPVPGSDFVNLVSGAPSRAESPDRSGRRQSARSRTPTSFWKPSVPTSYTSQGEAQYDLTASRPPSRPHSRGGSPRPDGAGAAKRARHGQ